MALVLLHGFAQTRDCFGPFADRLAQLTGREPLRPDLPGHGSSPAPATLDCPSIADRLARDCGPGTWFGYSMGARIALHVALERPDLVAQLVLLGGTAGIEAPAERAERAAADEARARHLEDVGVATFLEEWLAMDMFASLPPRARFEEQRAANTVDGLAASLRHAGTGSMAPVWDRLATLEMPVLCLAGGNDAPYVELAHRMADAIGPTAVAQEVPGAGHAAHLEDPVATAELIGAFLSS